MKVDGKPYRTIWLGEDGWSVEIIDQTRLPHDFVTARLTPWTRRHVRSRPCRCGARP